MFSLMYELRPKKKLSGEQIVEHSDEFHSCFAVRIGSWIARTADITILTPCSLVDVY